ncbi:unnamed protein product [Rhizophagus irregularis]|nr:unnamed protein product [Rhizophagus irregularis]
MTFFDNIADYEEDFNFIQNNENAFHFAMKRALENNSDSSTNNDFAIIMATNSNDNKYNKTRYTVVSKIIWKTLK